MLCFVLMFIMAATLTVSAFAESNFGEFADTYAASDLHVHLEIDLSSVDFNDNQVHVVYFYTSNEFGRNMWQPGVAFSIHPTSSNAFAFVYENLTGHVTFSIHTLYSVRPRGVNVPIPQRPSDPVTLPPSSIPTRVSKWYASWVQVTATMGDMGNDGLTLSSLTLTSTNPF